MNYSRYIPKVLVALVCACLVGIGDAASNQSSKKDDAGKQMSNARLDQLIRRVDPKAQGRAGFWQLTIEDHEVLVITDENADRMRIVMAITAAEDLDSQRMQRVLQANFDSALDARYAIARNTLWSAFIHPLSPLSDTEFLEGLGQVVNLGITFGTTYSSGLLIFQGGDSGAIQRRELIERLRRKGLET